MAANVATVMPEDLLKAAIEGNDQDLTQMLRLDGHDDRTVLNVVGVEGPNNLKSCTFMGNTVLHVLCTYGHHVLVGRVCRKDGSLLRTCNKMLETPLHCAAMAGQLEVVIKLIEFADNEGTDVSKELVMAKNRHGETPLHGAARHNHEDVIRQLMEIDPQCAKEVDNDQKSALDVAISGGNRPMVTTMTELLRRGIINPRPHGSPQNFGPQTAGIIDTPIETPASADINYSSAIHPAVLAGNIGMVEFLLDTDRRLAYSKDPDGLFPIHVAAREGHVRMVLIFMERCLDSGELRDHRGRNFLHIAAEQNISSTFGPLFGEQYCLFVRKFTAAGTLFENLRNNHRLKVWKKILEKMINQTDNEGNTPLHLAVEKKCRVAMFTLLANKAVEFHLANKKGMTPFDISVMQVKNSAENSVEMHDRIEYYINKYGNQFTFTWVTEFMLKLHGKEVNMTDRLQIIGLGAVLINTVTFAAAFTLPGGYNKDGAPLLGDNVILKTFILADMLAFGASFYCMIMLICGVLSSTESDSKDAYISMAFRVFHIAAKCLVVAFGIALSLAVSVNGWDSYVVLTIIGSATILDELPEVSQLLSFLRYVNVGHSRKISAYQVIMSMIIIFFRGFVFSIFIFVVFHIQFFSKQN